MDFKAEQRFPFGQFEGYEISEVIKRDQKYCEWILSQKGIKKRHAEFYLALEEAMAGVPQKDYGLIINFGKYYGKHIDEIITDEKYCRWLLSKSNLKSEYPNQYEYLLQIYSNDLHPNCSIFYVLVFDNENFIKIGKTNSYIVKRIFNYRKGMHLYLKSDINFEKSILFKNSYPGLEEFILKELAEYRLDQATERLIDDAYDEVINSVTKLSNNSPGHFFLKKRLSDFIPYDSHKMFEKNVKMYYDKPHKFQEMYLAQLKKDGLLEKYNPEFYGCSN